MSRGAPRRILVAAALLAGCAGRERHREPEQAVGRPARRCGQHVRPAARLPVAGGLPVASPAPTSCTSRSVRAAGSRRSPTGPSTSAPPTHRCRRISSRVQGVPADSVGARRHIGDGECEDERARAAAHHWPGAGEDLSRSGHELERPGDQGAQPGHLAPEPEDHPGLPLRRLRHVVQLHGLPVVASARRSSRRSASRRSRRSRRASAARARPASPASSRTPRARSAMPTSPTR